MNLVGLQPPRFVVGHSFPQRSSDHRIASLLDFLSPVSCWSFLPLCSGEVGFTCSMKGGFLLEFLAPLVRKGGCLKNWLNQERWRERATEERIASTKRDG
ncbi:hypothetical protein ACE6H2_006399 [Prunus campanulata]